MSDTVSVPQATSPVQEPRGGQVVAGNRWDLLEVPALGGWTPTRRVTVVIPYYQAPDALELTLAGLAVQTYPRNLLEVVVADDGSDPPLDLPERHRGLDVRVVHQEDRGFGLARARNTGASAATGDVLVFIDCDMVPEPRHVEAHARWHHVCGHAVTLGFRRHVEFDGIGPDDVAAAGESGALGPLFEGRSQQVPTWIDGHLARTANLTSTADDLFRVVTGGNFAVRADTYWAVGGSDESFAQWGAEDTELGYRLFVDGALLVPEPLALCWHQGHGHEPEPHEAASLEEQRAKLANLIAHHGFRGTIRGRTYELPRVLVEVDASGASREEVTATVTAVLASEPADLEVLLRLPDDHPDRVLLERAFGPDRRVVLDDRPPHRFVPLRVGLPAGAVVAPTTLALLHRLLTDVDRPLGLVRFTVPDRPPSDRHGWAVLTRAIRRAEAGGADDPTEEAGDLFGQAWFSGTDLGVRWMEPADLPQSGLLGQGAADLSAAELQELWSGFARLEPGQRRRMLAAARRLFDMNPRTRALLVSVGSKLLTAISLLGAFVKVRSLADLGALGRRVSGRGRGQQAPPRPQASPVEAPESDEGRR